MRDETTPEPVWGRMKSLARTKIVGWIRGRCRSWATVETIAKFSHGIIRRRVTRGHRNVKRRRRKRREERGALTSRHADFVSETSKISPAETSRDRADVKGPFDFGLLANPADGNTICILLRDDKNSFQLHLVDSTTGTIEQLSSLKEKEEVNSPSRGRRTVRLSVSRRVKIESLSGVCNARGKARRNI